MREPNLFIVGGAKCGTTSMASYFSQHPEIFFSTGWRKKEPYYFCSDFSSHKWRVSDRAEYLSIFANASMEKHVGEASPWYLYSRKAAHEIKRYAPSAKTIIMLRNPVDMMYSLHRQFLSTANEDRPVFEDALDAEQDRKNGKCIPKSSYFPEGLYYREVVSFPSQVRRYFDAVGRENVYVIIFDDLKGDVREVYRKTLEFLDVDSAFQANLGVRNAAKTVRSHRLQRFLFNPPWIISAIYHKFPQGLREPVSRRILDFLKGMNVRSGYDVGMNADTRARLQRELMPQVEELSAILDRDLTHWCRQLETEDEGEGTVATTASAKVSGQGDD